MGVTGSGRELMEIIVSTFGKYEVEEECCKEVVMIKIKKRRKPTLVNGRYKPLSHNDLLYKFYCTSGHTNGHALCENPY
ncbi:hypothetical protein FC679_29365 [Bacillus cereus]|uniref:hypothetical protein n=1 Tax=Bacillus cereus TaxID=1396 RepID=UPI0010BDDD4E|nr:hypothetical protein [Bacillus cereus]MCU4813918.1 hypothetical protein [Bacillus cereus]TKH53626.1 hypothetical protein FC679_29365 [Bacillus cereus]